MLNGRGGGGVKENSFGGNYQRRGVPNGGFFGQNPQGIMRRENIVGGDSLYTIMGEGNFQGRFEKDNHFYKRGRGFSRYLLHSDIQELHDKIQQMYVIGTSLVEQKTMDITDAQYITTLPIGMSRIVFKMLSFLICYFFVVIVIDFFLIFVIPKFSESYIHSSLFIFALMPFCLSLFFYKYFIESMRQYVMKNEKEKRTSKFYSIIISFWRVIEVFLGIMTIGSLIIYIKSLAVIYFIQTYWAKMGEFLRLQATMFDRSNIIAFFGDIALLLSSIVFLYVVFTIKLRNEFTKRQKENYINLLIQHNPSRVVREMLDGEL